VQWTPNRRTGALIGAGWIALIALVDGLLIWRVIGGPVNGITFICALLALFSLPAMALIGYWIVGLMRLRYEFDRNRLVIATTATRQIVPMGSIERVLDGRSEALCVHMCSPFWPGYWIGHGTVEGIGTTLFYAVAPPREQVIIVTPTLAYAISAPDIDTFMEVFEVALRMGPSVEVNQESQHAAYVHWPIWRDRLAQGILIGSTFVSVLLFGILCFRYPNLPARLPMHYDSTGAVDRIAVRNEAFDPPIISLIIWALNGLIGAFLYRHERIVSYLAWSGALVVQIFFLLALWNIVM
jgi:hypothetical protein